MIDTFRFGLAHPKMLGSLILDKTIKPVLILIVLFLINVLTMLGMNYVNIYMTNSERSYVVSNIMTDVDQNISFVDNKLSFVDKQYDILGFNIQFGEKIDYSKKTISLVFTENSVKSYYYNFKISEKLYSEYNFNNFVINNNRSDVVSFQEFIQTSFSLLYPIIITIQTLTSSFELLMSFLLAFFLVFLFTNGLNRQVLGILRIRLLMYSFISYFFVEWLSIIFENSFLSFITLAVPMLYFIIALKNIVSVKKTNDKQ